MSKILGAVEIGTHKAKAMVGVLSPAGDLKVVAASSVKLRKPQKPKSTRFTLPKPALT